MSYTTGCCCEKISCGYLIVTGRKYGVDPVYGDSGVDFWIRSFSEYADVPETRKCNASPALPHGAISPDLEIWKQPNLVTSFLPRNYIWNGSPYSEMRNFHYHIRGKIILPTKYKDIPIKRISQGQVQCHGAWPCQGGRPQECNRRQVQGRCDLPRRHPRPVDALLAGGQWRRPQQKG